MCSSFQHGCLSFCVQAGHVLSQKVLLNYTIILFVLLSVNILPNNYYNHPLDNTITDLTNLPDSCNKIIQQLSKFSLEAFNNNKLVFTFDEIKWVCPNIEAIPAAINGFGILKAVQHIGLTGKTMTLNFLHFTIQEFLAAQHAYVTTY